ncbi:MAG TPA: hypothetical protein VJP76_02650 [Candidatus Tumulicola sp.]|nr:hypothetical protein [Candidatus Tumulicola sp.]
MYIDLLPPHPAKVALASLHFSYAPWAALEPKVPVWKIEDRFGAKKLGAKLAQRSWPAQTHVPVEPPASTNAARFRSGKSPAGARTGYAAPGRRGSQAARSFKKSC